MFVILGADGKEYGPVTTGHIAEWIRDGRANLSTKARREDENTWKTLGVFEEFSIGPAAGLPPLVAAIPEAAAEPADRTVPASLWLRLPAALIDGLLKVLAFLPTTIPVTRMMIEQGLKGQQPSFTEVATILNNSLGKSIPLLAVLLGVQLVLLAWRGQSVGKLVIGLRIVRLDGSPAGFIHAFVLRSLAPFLFEQIPLFGLIFWIVDSSFVFRPDRRCVHDLIAGTKVVKA